MIYFQVLLLFALVLSVHPDRMDCNLPCPVDTFSQDYSSQIYGSPLPVYPPLTVTINYDKTGANEQESDKREKTTEDHEHSDLINSILHLPGKIADTLTRGGKRN